MSIFSGFLDRFKQDTSPAPAVTAVLASKFANPPQPEGEWTLIVDKNGDVVKNRAPVATDMLARPPVAFIDGGTLPGLGPARTIEEIQARTAFECRAQRNKELLEKAVFLLSQTEDGRRLINLATEKKFKLAFDPDTVAPRNAAGLCDYANKIIPLAEGMTAVEVALTVKHELQHMEDFSNGATVSLKDTPRSFIMASRAMEANARVSEAVAAVEMMQGTGRGPARQFKSEALMAEFFAGQPVMASAAQQNIGAAQKGDWKTFAQKVMPAFYKDPATIEFYDRDYAGLLMTRIYDVKYDFEKLAGRVANVPAQELDRCRKAIEYTKQGVRDLFTNPERKHEDIAPTLSIKRDFYVQGSGIDIGSDKMTRFVPAVKELFDKLKDRMDVALQSNGKDAHLPKEFAQVMKGAILPNSYEKARVTVPAFNPIIMPDRTDGAIGRPDGLRENAAATTKFSQDIAAKSSYEGLNTDLRKIHAVIKTDIAQARSNVRGSVGGLLQAGLRAPMAAFPAEYLHDLTRRLHGASGTQATAGTTGATLDRDELELVQHWRDLSKKGMDPVWLDDKNKLSMQQTAGMVQINTMAALVRILPDMPKQNAPAIKNTAEGLKR